MKKLTLDEFRRIEYSGEFARLHGIEQFKWGEIYLGEIPEDIDEDYRMYEKWFELHSTPLMKALREKDE